MMDGTLYLGGSGVRLTAISAAEMALWDIKGKAYGRPIHELLGGAFPSSPARLRQRPLPGGSNELRQVRENADRLREAGFTAMKFGWGGFGRDLKSDVALVRAAREAAGTDVRLMIDVGLCWDLSTTLERARALAEFDLYWLEAPMPHEPVSAWAELCARSPIRISCESPGGFWESLRFVREGRLHVILPDVSNVGGIGAWKRVAQAAATEGSWCVPALLQHWDSGVCFASPPRQPADGADDRVADGGLPTQHLAGRIRRCRWWMGTSTCRLVPASASNSIGRSSSDFGWVDTVSGNFRPLLDSSRAAHPGRSTGYGTRT